MNNPWYLGRGISSFGLIYDYSRKSMNKVRKRPSILYSSWWSELKRNHKRHQLICRTLNCQSPSYLIPWQPKPNLGTQGAESRHTPYQNAGVTRGLVGEKNRIPPFHLSSLFVIVFGRALPMLMLFTGDRHLYKVRKHTDWVGSAPASTKSMEKGKDSVFPLLIRY